MPKSKRDRTVSLTVTKKKGLELKQNLITEIRDNLDNYENLFIISMFNQRNIFLKELRQNFSGSKFLFGKNKVISIALGKSAESEYKENLYKIAPFLSGSVGLLFTNKSKDEVVSYFNEFSCPDYARSGNTATEDVTIGAGPLEQFQHTMEPQLRKLGLHTSLKKGIVTLDVDYTICNKGDKLTPDQARLLKLFEIMQATFKVNVKVYWNKSGEHEIIDGTIEENIEDEVESQKDNEEQDDQEMKDNEADEPKKKKLKNKNNAKENNNKTEN